MVARAESSFRILFAFLNDLDVKIFGFKIWGIKAYVSFRYAGDIKSNCYSSKSTF